VLFGYGLMITLPDTRISEGDSYVYVYFSLSVAVAGREHVQEEEELHLMVTLMFQPI